MKNYITKKNIDIIFESILFILAILVILINILIMLFLISKGIITFFEDSSIIRFLFSSRFEPTVSSQYIGSFVFIVGTILTSFFALLIAVPLAVLCAIFIVDISPKYGEKYLLPAIEILVGIPSTVYGLLGLTVIVPFFKNFFHLQGANAGQGLLPAIIVLVIMIFPYITFMTVDSLKSVNRDIISAAYGLGSTRWQMIILVQIPAAKMGVISGIILGFSRAMGEALAVSMVIGKRIALPNGLFSHTYTLTSVIASYLSDAVQGTAMYNSLWSMALLLLIMSFTLIIVIRKINKNKTYNV